MDTYIVVSIPDIWSPIDPPSEDNLNSWVPYEFKWIDKLGTNMIKEIEITCGSTVIQRYTGEYIDAMVDRDFSSEKKKLFNKMIGHDDTLNNPAYAHSRRNVYPNAGFTFSDVGLL